MVELARRGHQVTVVNPFPKSVKIPNYTEISLKECFPDNQFMFTIDDTIRMVESLYETANEFSQYVDVEERLYNSCQPIIQLVRSDERYDLVMTELFASDTFLPFVNKFQAPWIGLCANVLTPWTAHRINEVDNPSFVQTMLNIRPMNPRKSTFYERLYNTYIYVALKSIYYFVIEPKCQKVAEKYVGQYVDGPLSNVVTNVSLILSYSNFITNLPGPHSPIVKQIGGIHISEAKPLDQVSSIFYLETHISSSQIMFKRRVQMQNWEQKIGTTSVEVKSVKIRLLVIKRLLRIFAWLRRL